jgi:magnesium chelatase family protein
LELRVIVDLAPGLPRIPSAPAVSIDVHIGPGLPCMAIVGFPETAVKESRDRLRSAIPNTQFQSPPGRITVNLAPDDLPVAIALLIASEQVTGAAVADCELYGLQIVSPLLQLADD